MLAASAPPSTCHDDDIGLGVQDPVWPDLYAVGRGHPLDRLQRHETRGYVGAHPRRLGKHLVRADSIELIEPFVDDDVYSHAYPSRAARVHPKPEPYGDASEVISASVREGWRPRGLRRGGHPT